jgi:hypothetical protein
MLCLVLRYSYCYATATARNYDLSPSDQLMIALRFLGNGGQYHGIGDMHGIHKSTVQRALKRVCTSIMEIMFPEEKVAGQKCN